MARLLLTRPQAASERFAQQLRDAGVALEVLVSPLIRIAPLEVPQMAPEQLVIFTSQNGVAAAPKGQGQRAYVVGQATGAAASAAGYQPIVADGDAEALLRRILADAPQVELLHLRGQHARGDLAPRLRAAGLNCRDLVVYQQLEQQLSQPALAALDAAEPVILPVFSPRSGKIFAAQYQGKAPLLVAAISPAADRALGDLCCARREVLPEPTAMAMIAAVQRLMAAAQQLEGDFPER